MTVNEPDNFGGQLLMKYGAKSAPALTYGFPGWICIISFFLKSGRKDKKILPFSSYLTFATVFKHCFISDPVSRKIPWIILMFHVCC